jgi:hypothetical protein
MARAVLLLVFVLGAVALTSCELMRATESAPVIAAATIPPWEPVNPDFKGCEGG